MNEAEKSCCQLLAEEFAEKRCRKLHLPELPRLCLQRRITPQMVMLGLQAAELLLHL
jgi:hypothetical protein